MMMNNVCIVCIDFNNVLVVYVGDWECFYCIIDGGESWEIILDVVDLLQVVFGVNVIVVSLVNGQCILVGGVGGFWLIEDEGVNWFYLMGVLVYDIEFKFDDLQVLYLVCNYGIEFCCIFEKLEDGG